MIFKNNYVSGFNNKMNDPIDHQYKSMKKMKEGAEACRQLGCHDNSNCCIVSTSAGIGALFGTCVSPGGGTFLGGLIGGGIGILILFVKEM